VAQFYYDFEDQPIGAIDPLFFTETSDGAADEIIVDDNSAAVGSRVYRLKTVTDTHGISVPVAVPASVDSEIRCLFKSSNSSSNSGLALRVAGDFSSYYYFNRLQSALEIRRVIPASNFRFDYYGMVVPISQPGFFNVRARVSGTTTVTLEWKEWLVGTAEPFSWTQTSVDTSVDRIQTAGKMGFQSSRSDWPTGFDNVGFGTDGSSAPDSPVITTPTLSAPTVSGITANSASLDVSVTF